MMMREFELIMWACLNSKEHLQKFSTMAEPQVQLLKRLMMTAFYIKEHMSPKLEFECIKAFWVQNFQCFYGKYTTDFLMLEEPDLTVITPKVLNDKFMELKKIYEKQRMLEKFNDDEDDANDQNKDFNKMVEELGEEISRVDILRKQQIEKEERRRKQKKRLHE